VQAQNGFFPSPDGVLLAVCQADGRLEVWNLAAGQRRAVVSTGNTNPSVWWMPGGRELVTSNPGGRLAFWRVSQSGLVAPRAHTTIAGIAPDARTDPVVSPDGRTVALLPTGGTGPTGPIPLVDVSSGRRLRTLPIDGSGFSAAAFSPDSKTLAISSLEFSGPQGLVVMRDVATGARRATLSLPYIPAPGGLAIVRGGAWLVTTETGVTTGNPSASTRVDLWDAATLQPIGDPLTVPGDAAFLWPNGSGDKLGSGASADNGLPLVWNMNPASWEATACQIAGRNLSQAEWKQYRPGHLYRMTCSQWPAGT
jgi:WD40 repeat protein